VSVNLKNINIADRGPSASFPSKQTLVPLLPALVLWVLILSSARLLPTEPYEGALASALPSTPNNSALVKGLGSIRAEERDYVIRNVFSNIVGDENYRKRGIDFERLLNKVWT